MQLKQLFKYVEIKVDKERKKLSVSNGKLPGDIRTADENKAISSSVSCKEHKFFAKSNASFTRSSEPADQRGQNQC